MIPSPNRKNLNKAAEAMRKAASAELNAAMGKFRTGDHANPATKRARTRSTAKLRAIREDLS